MNHYNKIGILISLVILFSVYTVILYSKNTEYPAVSGTSTDRGKRIWQEKNCIACHQIYGLGGYLGPDLTNTYSEKGKDYIMAFLKSGTQVMPDFNLSQNEINDLTEYLKSIDASGTGRPGKLKINDDGTIEQPEKIPGR